MRMIAEACSICDVMIEGMLNVLRPGMYETQVAQWGDAIASELGVETHGFDVMVCAGEDNRTLIGRAMNRRINEGDCVMIGVAPRRDGLTSCERVSVVCVDDPRKITPEQKYWFDFVEGAYRVGLDEYIRVAENNLPAYLQEKALVDYFAARSDEVSKRYGKKIDMSMQKPYTGTHNDVAVRGYGNFWNDIVIPGLDYILVEKTLGKYGKHVEVLNKLPINVQHLVGMNF